jgi:hypothetical protein
VRLSVLLQGKGRKKHEQILNIKKIKTNFNLKKKNECRKSMEIYDIASMMFKTSWK